jgi:hypothetical protein
MLNVATKLIAIHFNSLLAIKITKANKKTSGTCIDLAEMG